MKKVFIAILSVVLMGSAAFAATTTLALYRCGEGYSPPALVGSDAQPLMDSSGNALHYATYMGSTWGGGPVTYSTDLPSLLAGYSTRSYEIVHNGFWDGAGNTYDWPDDNVGIEGWIKTTAASGAQVWGTIMFSLGGQFATYRENGKFFARVGSLDIGHTAVPEWQWVHLVLVRQGGTTTFYYNGKPVETTTTNPGNLGGAHQFEKDSGWTVWTGLTDEIRVFSFADPNDYDPILDNQYNSSALKAWDPIPAQDASGIPSTQILSWKTGRDPNSLAAPSALITGHGVYIGTDRAAVEAATPADVTGIFKGYQSVDQTTFAATLENNKTYYWRIDERLDSDNRYVKGWTWTFGTVIDFPVITGQPQDAYIKVGNSAILTVDAFDSQGKPLDYQWYKVGTPDEQLSDSSKYTGTDTKQLTVLNVAVADEASFYCKVTNSFGPTQSNSAALVAGRLLGHWPFDTDFNDVVDTNHGIPMQASGRPFLPVIDPNNGIVGKGAAKFSSTYGGFSTSDAAGSYDSNPAGGAVLIATPAPLMTDRSSSISFWEKTDPSGASLIFYASGNDAAGIDKTFMWRYTSNVYYAVRFGTSYDLYMGTFGPSVWHFVVVTYDRNATTSHLYVDGVEVTNANSAANYSGYANEIYIGNRKNMARPHNGLIDDLKLYNYALSALDVAEAYATVTGQEFCAQIPEVDINGDCVVNILDLVTIAANWTDCGLFPATACQ